MTKFKNLKVGESLSETQYYKVERIYASEVDLKDSLGTIITLNDNYVDKMLISASQFDKTEKINRTDAIALLTASANMAITVNFNKKIEPKDINAGKKAILELIEGKSTISDPVKFAKATLETITEGEERTMVGRHSGEFNEFGRLKFTDMQAGEGFNLRQIDPRTVNFMIIKGVKYEVK